MTLRIYTLGQFKLQIGDEQIDLRSRPAQSLIAYLAINADIPHRREKLSGLLWPDSTEENARSYLRQALWRIRKSLEEHSLLWEDYLTTNKINITFISDSDHWLDIRELMRDTTGLSPGEMGEILTLYQGELLPGFYDEWVPTERERYQTAFHQKMDGFTEQLIREQQWDLVIEWGETWIRLAHLPEAAFRALMSAYAALGDQAMLRSTYERCKEALASDLGVDVSPETAELFERLTHHEPARRRPAEREGAEGNIPAPAFLVDQEIRGTDRPVFVARQSELSQLSSLLEDVLNGTNNAIFITGEAGSGKTALLHEFTLSALAKYPELIVANGNCNAQTGVGDPYLPMREVLEMLSGDIDSRLKAGSLTRQQALRLWDVFPRTLTALLDQGPDLIGTFITDEQVLERANVIEEAYPSTAKRLREHIEHRLPPMYSTGIQQLAFFEQYTRVIQQLASTAPIVLVLDDLQWADQGSIALLFHLGREISGCPILILGSFRQEEVALGRGDERHPLEPVISEFQRLFGTRSLDMGSANTKEFVHEFLDSEPNQLGADFREMLYRRTQGHALFTVELLRKMQESGELVKDEDGLWQEGTNLDWESLPARVEAVVAERIKRLTPSAQAVLRAASVEGEVFTAEILGEVLDLNAGELLPLLSAELDRAHQIVRAESINRVGEQLISSYRFRHTLFQKYLYGSLDEIERVHLHQAFGTATEKVLIGQQVPTANALQLARHFEIAGIMEKAIEYLHQAGDRAIQISGNAEGIIHLTRALSLLKNQAYSPERDEKELAIQLSIAMSWKYNWASMTGSEAIDRIRELSMKLNKRIPLARMLGEQSIRHYVGADYKQAFTHAEECLLMAEQEQDPMLLTEAYWLLGIYNFSTANYKAALEYLDKVDAFYNPHEHHELLLYMRGVDAGLSAGSYRACCLWCLGYPDHALDASRETISHARTFNHAFTLADVLSYAGCLLFALVGDSKALKTTAEELSYLSEVANLSLSGWAGMSKYFLGHALTLQGEYRKAIPMIKDSIAMSDSIGVYLYKPMALGFLALAQIDAGDGKAALETIDEALSIIEETGERLWEVELYRIRARVRLAASEHESARADLVYALEVSRAQEAKSWELRIAIDFASVLKEDGKSDDARALLSECYDWFSEKFDTPDLKQARELLASLT